MLAALVVLAIVSSFRNGCLPQHLFAFGEIGLSGELRSVSDLAKRVREAEKLGFTKIYIPKLGKKITSKTADIIEIQDLQSLMKG